MMMSLQELNKKYKISSQGIMHAGAHLLEERQAYLSSGVKNIFWIEGNPALAGHIRNIIHSSSSPSCEEIFASTLVDDIGGKKVTFHLAENTQTSSILSFGTHSQEMPGVAHNGAIDIQTQRLDQLIEEFGLSGNCFDFLNVDVQGVELRVIRGLGCHLKHIKWIYTEINLRETYLGCDKLWMLDFYLVFRGFRRKELWLATRSWGDAFYERVNAGGILQGIFPFIKYLSQNIYFFIGNFLRPLLGMK